MFKKLYGYQKELDVLQKYLLLGGVLFIVSNLFLLLFIDNVSLVDVFEEILFTSSLKEILNRVLYTLVVCVAGWLICKFIGIYLHYKGLTIYEKLQETLNGRGIDMSNVSPETAETLISGIFGESAVNERFSQSRKMSSVSNVMTQIANEKGDLFDLANLLLDKQFMLKSAQIHQELKTHIINITNGVDVQLKESELLSLVQQTGRSKEQLLEDYPNLKVEDKSEKVETADQNTDQNVETESENVVSLSVLNTTDSKFLLENVFFHESVLNSLSSFDIDVENLTVDAFTSEICMVIVETLSNVKADIEDQDTLIHCMVLLHKITALHDELDDNQWKVFAGFISFANEKPSDKLPETPEVTANENQVANDLDSKVDIKQYLSNEDDAFTRDTISGCLALQNECKTLSVVLNKPIDFDAIGKNKVEKLAQIAFQLKNQNKGDKGDKIKLANYTKLETLLKDVIAKM